MAIPTDFFTFHNVIAGKCRSSERTDRTINPSDRKPLWEVPVASTQDLDDAVASAQNAFVKWSKTKWSDRQSYLARARDVLFQNRDQVAQLIVQEGGKPPQFAALEVEHALNFLDFYINHSPIKTEIMQDDKDLRISVSYAPLGVVAAICPWNYPLVLAMGKISAALVTGNCVITKPSPFTPYSILKFTELVRDIFPPGVIQALHGDASLGPRICQHPDIQKISFTGSTATGKKIMESASKTLKRVTLELGGNNASIVCSDIDVDIVAPQIALGSFFNSGQLCVASKRIYVHQDIYEKFLTKMVEVVKSWKVGPATTPGIMLGPLQNEAQYKIVKEFFLDTMKNGYMFALGGQDFNTTDNFVIEPAIVANPPDDSLVVTGEAFGPIVPVMSWSDEEDLIKRVNATTTGLGGAVWSSNTEEAHRLAALTDAGTIWINSFEKPLPQAFFAGRKESGLGGEWGSQGLLSYCSSQTIHHYKAPVTPNL
ncbi:Aldehyde/histidinol dehydrogenase [Ilyonectria robusta]|uniref:Aldehyde/histidinol dehydrogenase n=1 Tax=Ilyonectria robusta TaxID=1079257 RepID=UPI001E8E356B|nr:Aldehyde/histidinol dehydrogenase [Ilyonectria robusta]KAH8664822.1 Aldehyde/histidinol dehydrogenase [Ilyonectria robusta]